MIVYKLTNMDNGKIYIGQTKFTVEKRFKEHAKAKSLIGEAIRDYGEEHFLLEVLKICETREEAYALEISFIAKFNCMAPNGYNLTKGGRYCPPYKSQRENGCGFVMSYSGAICKLVKMNPTISAIRLFLYIAHNQQYGEDGVHFGFSCTKTHLREALNLDRKSVYTALKWLEEQQLVLETKIKGNTEFMVNPHCVTIGSRKKKRVSAWNQRWDEHFKKLEEE